MFDTMVKFEDFGDQVRLSGDPASLDNVSKLIKTSFADWNEVPIKCTAKDDVVRNFRQLSYMFPKVYFNSPILGSKKMFDFEGRVLIGWNT